MKTPSLLLLSCLAAAVSATLNPAFAADRRAATSPEMLTVTQVNLKPGKAAEFEKSRGTAVQVLAAAHWPGTIIGLRSVSGPDDVWLLNFHGGMGDLEDDHNRITHDSNLQARLGELEQAQGALISGRNELIANFLKNLSYQPGFDWADVRYLDVITVHVRPGHHLEYLELRRMSAAAHEKGGVDGPLHVFKVISGTQGLTWMILRPLKSLHAYDELKAKGFGEPLTPEEDKKMIELRAVSMEYAEERFFRIEPAMSLVPRDWEKPDAPFWSGQP